MQGWFKVHRELFESELWHDVSTFRLFIYLISQASHRDGIKIKGIELKRGQYIRSYRKLADDLSYKEGRGYKKYALSTIKSSVNKLVSAERVNVKETEAGTLFTVVNYDRYQYLEGFEDETPNGENGEPRTKSELSPNEPRTKSEQEQELKNLRTKELKTLSSSSSSPAPENSLIDLDLKSVIDFYQNQYFGMITPHIADKMAEWINDTSKDLVIHAMKLAIESGTIKWSYTEGILKNWTTRKLETVEQVEAFELQRKQQNAKQRPGARRQTRDEAVPDWFANRQSKQPASNTYAPIDFDVEAERIKLMRELQEG